MISVLVNFILFIINCMLAGCELHEYLTRAKSNEGNWVNLSLAIMLILSAASMLFD